MTRICRVSRKVEDLKIGDLFVSCFSRGDNVYPSARMIMEIEESRIYRYATLADGSIAPIMKGMNIIVETIA